MGEAMSAMAEENKRRFLVRTEVETRRAGTYKRPKVWERRKEMRRHSRDGVALRRQA